MKVYVALVDIWDGSNGCDWNLIGVYDSLGKVRKGLRGYEDRFYTKIISVDINEEAHQYIGGYVENCPNTSQTS